VHKAIEHYMRAKIAGLQLDGEPITDEWDEIWDEATESAEFAAREDVEALKASGAQLARQIPARNCTQELLDIAIREGISQNTNGPHKE
jgi:hypothetical protein